MKKNIGLLLALLLWSTLSSAALTSFEVKEIRLENLSRISEATVLNYLPVKKGSTLNQQKADEALRALFKTGFFDDVSLHRDGDVLVVRFVERPSIAKIKLSGNEKIETDQLKDGLKKIGLAEGRIFNRSLLEQVEQELQRQYFALGKYGVSIKSKVEEQSRNRVSIEIEINEGDVALVRDINIIGFHAFDKATLMRRFETDPYQIGDSLVSDAEYTRQKLAADLENLRSYYLDRGYINFDISSTQVSISPDKRNVYVTVNLDEGSKYSVAGVSLSGNLIVDEAELRGMIEIKDGDVFSRKLITESSTRISERLGEEGYAFANVNAIPEINEDDKTVKLTFFVDPGKRVYIRRVNFIGNSKTQDEVLRRELRQLEGGWYSTSKINRSKVRIQRTGFIDQVNVDRLSVPGRPDLVDVVFSVTERPSGSITASMGYGQGSGMILSASVNQNNFLGTGKSVSAEVNNSDINRKYSFRLTDPYYTLDGVSRTISLYLNETNASATNRISGYQADVYGASMSFGFPMSEYRTARVGLGYDHTDIDIASTAASAYRRFTDDFGTTFNTFTLTASWSYDTRNRIVFPEKGTDINISTDIALPAADISFYKVNYRQQLFWQLWSPVVFHLDGTVAYGDGLGNTDRLPFYENYYAGGGQSVRGFRDFSLGPKDDINDRTVGGNRKATGTMELLFPPPMSEDNRTVRLSAFIDAGNVWGDGSDARSLVAHIEQLRASYGASLLWITPVGGLRFSWAWPLKTEEGDQTQRFQFSIGAPF
ncbi:MAG: outer membrane protein assembly factor BamA [Gammaproteobacteria bacterium]|nr:outer membrane protein assembly factor BamA [Gammaproteobacteria bacterium]